MKLPKYFPPIFVALLLGVFVSVMFAVDHTEPVPLPSLGTDTYLGQEGGLYPNHSNTLPTNYLTNQIQPIYDLLENDSHIVVLCLGMSNLTWTCDNFINKANGNANVNSVLKFVNAGQPGRAQQAWDGNVAESDGVWANADKRLEQEGESPSSVDVVLYFNAWAHPTEPDFATYTSTMLSSLKISMANIPDAYPNTQLIYITSREYAGYVINTLNPDPWAYWDGFAYKRLVADRINGVIGGPPILWQAYQYDPTWPASYFKPNDGVHLSDAGLDVAGQLWLDFFLTQPWFHSGDGPTATPASTPAFEYNEFLPAIIHDP
jgi:hypothetical protein